MFSISTNDVSPTLALLSKSFPYLRTQSERSGIWQRLHVGLKVKGHSNWVKGGNYSILLSAPEEVLNYLFLSLLRFKRGLNESGMKN